jgi:signal peptidase I
LAGASRRRSRRTDRDCRRVGLCSLPWIGSSHRHLVLLSLLVTLAGCGGSAGSGQADKVKASFAQWVHDLQHRNVAAACDDMTPEFWGGFASDVNQELAIAGRSVPTNNCRAGLRSLFALSARGSIIRSGASIADVRVQGSTATARQGGTSAQHLALRFVHRNGRWLIDCCLGRQLEQQPQTNYRIPSAGMMPTLHVGQVIVSDNAALRAHPPALGAIVVFHPPAGADAFDPKCGVPHEGAGFPRACGVPTAAESPEVFIKRVVGLPGDRIALVDGTVMRNGTPEPRNYRVVPCAGADLCTFRQPITIPPDEYFVLGDNLPNSEDSRVWGPVKRSWLIGLVKVGR